MKRLLAVLAVLIVTAGCTHTVTRRAVIYCSPGSSACPNTTDEPDDTTTIAGSTTTVSLSTTTAPNGPSTTIAPAPTPVQCGVERWAIKTATDPAAANINLTPIPTTIGALASKPSQLTATNGDTRLPDEMQTYTLTTTLIAYKVEADSDIHLVLSDSTGHMIAEIPNPGCVAAGGILRDAIAQARADFVAKTGFVGVTRMGVAADVDSTGTAGFTNVSIPVVIIGVLFYDQLHGQTGVAPNGVELHPVTAISFP